MKTLSMILSFLIIPIVVIGQNLKALDDKNGFRKATFGMSPYSFKNLEQVMVQPLIGLKEDRNPKNSKFYPVQGEYYDKDVDLYIGNFPLDYIKYYFYKNKLVTIEIKVRKGKGLNNQNGVLEVLETAYGKGVLKKVNNTSAVDNNSYSNYSWEGGKVKMKYTISEYDESFSEDEDAFNGGEIFITNKELKNLEDKDSIKESQTEEQRKNQEILDAKKKL